MFVALAAPALGQDRSALVDEGQRAFMRNGCYGCHTIGRRGTPIAPDLSHVGAKYGAEYIAHWLRDPRAVRPSGHMPMLELADEEIRALAAFLAAQQ